MTDIQKTTKEIMIVHDDPGIETRIAILEDGRLEELYTERTRTATGVGNIYKGRVTNVESAIQAAFIEYGGAQRGFLHITDLHPRYFPGKETSERVGKKIPKHNRPPIQRCLKKGDEILVQVLKEGIGTKGPTLTSYLSIPGRLSVMMPFMDKVGVSKKIEDESDRKKMRKILDSLNLPSGFGFILRTAGLGKTKIDVKRDIAYLIRLWKLIEKRIDKVGAPCQLYNESDLLVRTIRDILRPSIDVIVVDSESSYERITSFLKIAAPRSSRKIIQYREASPIFHAFNIEKQIDEIHCREVELPSGGRLVIDQTEALVAIDVNSGKSRGAKNSEANAVNTNLEAADAICRHLRLRDLGGIVINDLIDMGQSSNRRKVEKRFQDNLARDRARSTVLPISRFGLMEMTRQRIRPSVLDSHYVSCSQCDGRGNIKTTEEVAADATRHCGWLLHHINVHRVELTCSASVGTFLLSNKRSELDSYEKRSKKRIVVRISEELAKDRLVYYVYDARGADIELETLVASKPLSIAALIKADNSYVADDENSEEKTGRRRSRRRSSKKLPLAEAASISAGSDLQEELDSLDKVEPEVKKGRKQNQREDVRNEETPADSAMRVFQFAKSLGKSSKEVIAQCTQEGFSVRNHMSTLNSEIITKLKEGFEELVEKKKPRRRRRRKNSKAKKSNDAVATATSTESAPVDTKEAATEKKVVKKKTRKRSRRTSNRSNKKANPAEAKKATKAKVEVVEPKKKPRKTLYGGRRRSVTTDEIQASRDTRP
ncbi:MAG: Rne/Rng family ribonuclease [Phycisphaerae bacterium]|nr:Rne/Rng family ribonuclease [Phycisphaerae bacterium]MBT6269170.1 Rne/Rng family ribonuclease [Phycisphaerae bacterium]MBT6283467.1 Rne/Rng family ribonuclease [Phycisphaerae bacterium]